MPEKEVISVEDLSKMTVEELLAAPSGCTLCTHTCGGKTLAAEEA